tara:strand:+ start:395 stop:619 length:225 start_codon:yes stop_codon:yes gene_type:complete
MRFKITTKKNNIMDVKTFKTRYKTLKEVSKKLKISVYQVNKLRNKLINKYNCPEYMIHGTNGYKWNIECFKSVM